MFFSLLYHIVRYHISHMLGALYFRFSFQAAEWRAVASLCLLNFSQNSTVGTGLAAGSLLVAYLVLHDSSLTPGDYVLFTTYMLQLYAPLNFFGSLYR